MYRNFGRTVFFRANPTELEEEEEGVAGGGGAEEKPPRGPDPEAAARRVAEREEKRRAKAESDAAAQAAAQVRDREFEELKRFRQDAEPSLKLVNQLKSVFGGKVGAEEDPLPPDAYDPEQPHKLREWNRTAIQTALQKERASILAEVRQTMSLEAQRKSMEEREQARQRGNNELVKSFFGETERSGWPQEKRDQLLLFAKARVHATGEHGEYTKEDLEIAEERLFRDEVLARAEAKGADRIMGHLGAPPKRGTRQSAKGSTPEEIEARAEEFMERIEDLGPKAQQRRIEQLATSDPDAYALLMKTIASIPETGTE